MKEADAVEHVYMLDVRREEDRKRGLFSEVFLNGQKTVCIAASPDRVLVRRRDIYGKYVYNFEKDEVETEVLFGDVTIRSRKPAETTPVLADKAPEAVSKAEINMTFGSSRAEIARFQRDTWQTARQRLEAALRRGAK